MTKLEKKIQEITKHECKQSELWTIINYVVNPHFETFDKIEEEHFLERDFKLVSKAHKWLSKDEQETIYKTDFGYEISYNYLTNIFTLTDSNDEYLVFRAKIWNKLQLNIIMESHSLFICE
ncbi:MAG: hypothetical protein GY849_00680 [Deltaproteobacteria bacterium]|nr:hypothetical protein [Deltaproteobacteria bacterium]